MKKWFFRFCAVYFLVSTVTGLVLYFRPGGNRPGIYSNHVKEWFVMVHNGEWISHVLFGQPFFSGLLVGLLMAWYLGRHALSGLLKKRRVPAPILARETTLRRAS